MNVVAFSADADSNPDHYPPPSNETVQKVSVEEVLAAYEGWGPEVRDLLGCAENPTKWTINVVYPPIPPEKWVRGPVAILGDAAHGMLPHLGSGAGQGLEDAYLLGKLLGHPQTTLQNVEVRIHPSYLCKRHLRRSQDVLRTYAAVRQPRAYKVWEFSRRAGDIWDKRWGAESFPFEEVKDMWTWVWDYPLDQAFAEAIVLLTSNGIFKNALRE